MWRFNRWYHWVTVAVSLATLIGGLATAGVRVTSHFVTQEEMQHHVELEDAKLDALAARLSEDIADKIMDRMDRRRR